MGNHLALICTMKMVMMMIDVDDPIHHDYDDDDVDDNVDEG